MELVIEILDDGKKATITMFRKNVDINTLTKLQLGAAKYFGNEVREAIDTMMDNKKILKKRAEIEAEIEGCRRIAIKLKTESKTLTEIMKTKKTIDALAATVKTLDWVLGNCIGVVEHVRIAERKLNDKVRSRRN